MKTWHIISILALCLCSSLAFGQKMPANDEATKAKAMAAFEKLMSSEDWPEPEGLAESQAYKGLNLTVDGQLRKAIVIYPKSALAGEKAPVVFVFHGRRGLLPRVMGSMSIYKDFQEAIVVYPQGLWVDTPKATKIQWGTGWKMAAPNGDWRDIDLFDALLDTISTTFAVDPNRIYAMGHSNGGGMTYSLWSVRGDKLAAVSVCCCSSRKEGFLPDQRKAKPVFFVIATQDQLVDFDKYKSYIDFVLSRQTTGEPQAIAPGKSFYPASAGGADVIVDIIEAPHQVDKPAMPLIADFFRNHTL